MKIKDKKELEKAKKAAMKLVKQRAGASGMVAALPIPGIDIAADIGLIMDVLNKINKRFGLSNEEIEELDSDEKQKIMIIVTSIGNQFVGKVLTKELIITSMQKVTFNKLNETQLVKFVPFVGPAISGGISYAAMYKLGKDHVEECYEICLKILEEQ